MAPQNNMGEANIFIGVVRIHKDNSRVVQYQNLLNFGWSSQYVYPQYFSKALYLDMFTQPYMNDVSCIAIS